MINLGLTDQERAQIRRLRARVGYVGVVHFRGPRGRRYRPTRTSVCVTREQADTAVAGLRAGQYRGNPIPTSSAVYTVDHLGRIQEDS
jgi:hypothetical protein